MRRQATEVDEPLDTGAAHGGRERRRAATVGRREVAAGVAAHRVHEVVGHLGAVQRLGQPGARQHVAADDAHATRQPRPAGIAHQARDAMAPVQQRGQQRAADGAGRPGEQHVAGAVVAHSDSSSTSVPAGSSPSPRGMIASASACAIELSTWDP